MLNGLRTFLNDTPSTDRIIYERLKLLFPPSLLTWRPVGQEEEVGDGKHMVREQYFKQTFNLPHAHAQTHTPRLTLVLPTVIIACLSVMTDD